MQTKNSKTRLAVVLTASLLSIGLFAACSPKPQDQNEIALTEATQKAQEASARADAAQKALADAQAEQKAAQDRAAANEVQADAASKLKAAETRAANAERDAASARRRAAAAEHQSTHRAATVAASQPVAQPKPVCYDCGTVSSVVPVTVQGKGTGMGAVAGAIAGAVIGHQFGRGQGNKVAEAAGAIAGGYGGNVAEKHIRGSTVYDVTVSLDNGGSRVVRVEDAAGISTGERVRVEGSNIIRL